jgi:hypothetical protein
LYIDRGWHGTARYTTETDIMLYKPRLKEGVKFRKFNFSTSHLIGEADFPREKTFPKSPCNIYNLIIKKIYI